MRRNTAVGWSGLVELENPIWMHTRLSIYRIEKKGKRKKKDHHITKAYVDNMGSPCHTADTIMPWIVD